MLNLTKPYLLLDYFGQEKIEVFSVSQHIVITMNETRATNTSELEQHHKMSIAWMFNPVILGLIGTIINSFILYVFYSERQTFIKPINFLIW